MKQKSDPPREGGMSSSMHSMFGAKEVAVKQPKFHLRDLLKPRNLETALKIGICLCVAGLAVMTLLWFVSRTKNPATPTPTGQSLRSVILAPSH